MDRWWEKRNQYGADVSRLLVQFIWGFKHFFAKKLLKMINLQNIVDYAGENIGQRNFVEGERIVKANHIISCGKLANDPSCIKALCLQTSNLKEKPHEITGNISKEGFINNFKCSCKAGLSGKCKHTIATLLQCYFSGNTLPSISCTDDSCSWKKVHSQSLKLYEPVPLENHSCFYLPKRRRCDTSKHKLEVLKENQDSNIEIQKSCLSIKINDVPEKTYLDVIKKNLPNCAIVKSIEGRHQVISVQAKNKFTDFDRSIFKFIFEHQDSPLLEIVSQFKVDVELQQCCLDNLSKLNVDGVNVCERTKNWIAEWFKERQYRITGSTCYGLLTYLKNKNPNWVKKCNDFLSPSSYKSAAMKYGSEMEKEARNEFRAMHPEYQVVETGLIISQVNPWLGYSPDGIVVKNNIPYALLEIKCPMSGKKKGIEETVEDQISKCLIRKDGKIELKCKHNYYGQVQLGMCVLNLKKNIFYYLFFKRKKNF